VAQEASASSANGGGLAEQRKKLERRQKKLEGEVEMLRGKKRVEQAQLDGACVVVCCRSQSASIVSDLNLNDHPSHSP
jgi:hypothetical protein